MPDFVDHNDLIKLHQYHISLYRSLEKFEKDSPEHKHGSDISRLSKKIVEVSTRIVDERVEGGAKVSEPNTQTITLMYVNGLLLTLIVAFQVMLFMSVQTLESKVFPTGKLFVEEDR